MREPTDADRAALTALAAARMSDLLHRHVLGAVKHVQAHKWSWPFNAPVDLEQVGEWRVGAVVAAASLCFFLTPTPLLPLPRLQYPTYRTVVADPIDLGTIRQRLEAGARAAAALPGTPPPPSVVRLYTHPDQVEADVARVFANAKAFNPAGTDVHLMADALATRFSARWAALIAPRSAALPAAAASDESAVLFGPPGGRSVAGRLAAAAARLGPGLDALAARIKAAKAAAIAATPPMPRADREALVGALSTLAPDRFEAAVALALARSPALAAAAAAGGGTLDLDVATLDAVTARQLAHYAASCGAAGAEGGVGRAAGAAAPALAFWPGLVAGAGVRAFGPALPPSRRRSRDGDEGDGDGDDVLSPRAPPSADGAASEQGERGGAADGERAGPDTPAPAGGAPPAGASPGGGAAAGAARSMAAVDASSRCPLHKGEEEDEDEDEEDDEEEEEDDGGESSE